MKIAITGHSAGIGKTLYDSLIHDHEIIGFSLENGFDIGLEGIRQQVISLSADTDVFINNAYHIIGQIDLLKKITHAWNGENKIIINVSSKVVFSKDPNDPVDIKYIESKKKLQQVVEDRNNSLPKIYNILLGCVDTELSKTLNYPKLSTEAIADFIKYILKNKDNIWIQEVILTSPDLELL
jgi:hypothetical protein